MISPREMAALVEKEYDWENIHIGVLGSHSALDVLDGAKDEGFKTVVICQKGRELPYLRFRRLADEVIVLERFRDIIRENVQDKLRKLNTIFVPNRSFSVYVGYESIEEEFYVPIFGSRQLLRAEERYGEVNYYKILDAAGILRPKTFKSPDEIDRPVIVKAMAAGSVERAFFIARNSKDFWRKARDFMERGLLEEEELRRASIEEFVVGVDFNFNYFHSVVRGDVEFHGIDRRLQTNVHGLVRLPAFIQMDLDVVVRNVEIGHMPATIRESQLQKVFEMGDAFVRAAKELYPPGIIGPFTLQSIVTSDLKIYVVDVAFRIGGGTNIYAGVGSQYSKFYFGEPISMGRRIAIEIREAIEKEALGSVVT
ncbi:MAG: formate--phosphoribosylaminoimidazolecarboxamide ligase family protein [Candidatus Baldrarchaeia archaeon]